MKKSFWFMWKKGLRTLTKNRGKTIPLIAVITLSVGLSAMMFDMLETRGSIIEDVIEISNFADGIVYLEPSRKFVITDAMNKLEKNYIEDYEVRFNMRVSYEIKGERYEGMLIGVDTSKKHHINRVVDLNKTEIKDYRFCLNWNFASDHDIKEGEHIIIKNGNQRTDVEIKTIGFTPDYLYTPIYSDVVYPSIEPFPVLFVSLDFINDEYFHEKVTYVNSIYYALKEGISQEEASKEINKVLGDHVKQVMAKEDYPFIKRMREIDEEDKQMLYGIFIVFIFAAVFTLLIVIRRLMDYEMKSISVFQGLGTVKSEIIGGYLIFNILVNLISLIFGAIITYLFEIPIGDLYSDVMGIPFFPEVQFNVNNFMIVTMSILILSILATYFSVRRTFKMDVQQSMKFETEFLNKTNILEKMIFKIKRNLHPFKKYTIRRAVGKKIYLVFILLSLITSSSLLLFFYGFSDSFVYSIHLKLDQVEQWDASASTWEYEYQNPLRKTFNEIPRVEYYEFGIVDTVLIDTDSIVPFSQSLRIYAYQDDARLHKLLPDNDVALQNEYEVYVSRDVLVEYDLKIGDYITVKKIASEFGEKIRTYEVKIVDTINDLAIHSMYMSVDDAQIIINREAQYNVIYFNVRGDVQTVGDRVQNMKMIQSVIIREDLEKTLTSSLELFTSSGYIYSIIFLLFGFLIISVIVKNLLEYRLEDYANMKALGLLDLEIRKSIFLELLVYFLISLPFGMLFGILFLHGMMESYTTVQPGIYFQIYPLSYLYFLISDAMMLFGVLILQFRKIKIMNITTTTRERTFG